MEKSKFIPYGRQDITEEDIEAVIKVLRSDFLTQGPVVPVFEQRLCDYTGAKYAIAVNSCTSALHVACLALGLGLGDILWTSPITFVASANCALYCGAIVDFVDIEPDTALMSVEKLKQKLELAEKEGKLPKIVIPVHFSGQPCDMKEIYDLGQQYGFKIIEDAAHAIGAKYQNGIVGNCQYSDITVFSFHPVKIITTGEGGVAMTNSPLYAEKMDLLRSHGITRDTAKMQKKPDGPWYYEQIKLGFNYRMTDIQASLGNSQLKRLDQYVAYRNKIAELYNEQFKNTTIKSLVKKSGRASACHLYVIRVADNKVRKALFSKLLDIGVKANVHYIPIIKQPYYQNMGYKIEQFPVTNAYYQSTLSIPLYYGLSNVDQELVISSIKKLLNK